MCACGARCVNARVSVRMTECSRKDLLLLVAIHKRWNLYKPFEHTMSRQPSSMLLSLFIICLAFSSIPLHSSSSSSLSSSSSSACVLVLLLLCVCCACVATGVCSCDGISNRTVIINGECVHRLCERINLNRRK